MRFSESDFVVMLKEETSCYKKSLHHMLDGMATLIPKLLSEAEPGDDVEIHICKGVTLIAKCDEPRTMRNPQTNEPVEVGHRCLFSCRFSEKFKEDTRALFDEKMQDKLLLKKVRDYEQED